MMFRDSSKVLESEIAYPLNRKRVQNSVLILELGQIWVSGPVQSGNSYTQSGRTLTGIYLEITLKTLKEQGQGNCSGMRKERLLQLSKTFALRQMKQRPWQEIIVVSQVCSCIKYSITGTKIDPNTLLLF